MKILWKITFSEKCFLVFPFSIAETPRRNPINAMKNKGQWWYSYMCLHFKDKLYLNHLSSLEGQSFCSNHPFGWWGLFNIIVLDAFHVILIMFNIISALEKGRIWSEPFWWQTRSKENNHSPLSPQTRFSHFGTSCFLKMTKWQM